MKTTLKTVFTFLVVLLVASAVLAGCSNNKTKTDNTSSETPTETPNVTENPTETDDDKYVLGEQPLSFTFYGNYDWYTMPTWGADTATGWIKDNLNVTVEAISSGGNASQKFSTMVVSGDLPDVMWMERGPDVERLREAGMLVPLDDFLDKYTNLKEWLGEEGINMLRSPDGKIYQFPNWYTSQPNGNTGYVINKKIYEALGSPKLETTEDLYLYLQEVKVKFPNVIPFDPHIDSQGLNVLYSAFGENNPPIYLNIHAVPSGDKLTSIFTQAEFRESMKFSRKLFGEKLISQDALTQTLDQVSEKVMNGNVAVYAAASPTDISYRAHMALKGKDADAGYFMIWPFHKPGLDKNKIFPGTYTQLGWNVSVITKSAKDPEAIFAFLDWLTGPEGQRILFWGPEGKYWAGLDGDGFPIFTEAYVNDPEGVQQIESGSVSFMWNGNTVYVDQSKARFEMTLPEEQRSWILHHQHEITWPTHYNATEFINLSPMPDSEEGMIQQRITDIYTVARAQALYAKSDDEVIAILDKAEKDAQAAGYAQLLEYKTTKWQANLQKMRGN